MGRGGRGDRELGWVGLEGEEGAWRCGRGVGSGDWGRRVVGGGQRRWRGGNGSARRRGQREAIGWGEGGARSMECCGHRGGRGRGC